MDGPPLDALGPCANGGYNAAMRIELNGQAHECPPGQTLNRLLADAGYGGRRVAVEVNRDPCRAGACAHTCCTRATAWRSCTPSAAAERAAERAVPTPRTGAAHAPATMRALRIPPDTPCTTR